MSRLPQIFFLCEFWAETASEKEAVPCQNSSWDDKWYGSRERRPEYHHCLHRARRLWRAGTHVRVQHIYIRTGENSIRTRRLDRNGGGGLQVAPEKGLDPKLPCGWRHTSTPNRRWQNRECCQQVPIRGRAAVIFRRCSSARNPARVAS